MSLLETLKGSLAGDVTDAADERAKYSRDTSLFERTPSLVVYPKDADDVSALVKAVHDAKASGENVSVTARSAGTDMSGGPLTDSVVAVFTKYMNHIGPVTKTEGTAEPGAYYRDFEKETLKHGVLLPSYPASRELAAMGGIVNNNSGGERTLAYGKTEHYIEAVDVVLSDGTKTTFKELAPAEVAEKQALPGLEGDIYRKMGALLEAHKDLIAKKKPHVSKNSAGYALWNVIDPATGTWNLAKLICGAQGTLAFTTAMTLRLVHPKERRAMLVIFLNDLSLLPELVKRILPLAPESFESYDDKTFTFATKFLFDILKQLGLAKAVKLGIEFLPEVESVITGGVPKLILMAEFAEDTISEADAKVAQAREAIADMHLETHVEKDEDASEKFWIVRRESFALLRKSLHGYYASPFIDDFVVPPERYAEFLPEFNALLASYKDKFIYTVAGHIGNGNFHVIPLMDLSKPEVRQVILELAPKVYDLVIRYGGTTTGEHNDGIIRTPYLSKLFGPDMMKLFEETKHIFDPLGVFNPGKKVGGTFADIDRDMISSMK